MKFSNVCSRVCCVLVMTIAFLPAGTSYSQKIHVLVASDQSEWAGWGEHAPNIFLDAALFALAFENNVPEQQLNLLRHVIELEPGSPEILLQELNRFSIGPEDTMVFYFSGHGESDNQGHYLNLQNGKLYRSKIIETIQAKHPRLAVVITDCCNVRGDKFAHFAPYIESTPPRVIAPLFDSLFIQPKGLVDINASSPGESAYFFNRNNDGEFQGSLFSATVSKALENNRDRRLTWGQLIDHVSVIVYDAFQREYPTGIATALKGKQGDTRQKTQHVHAITYPDMPQNVGPRTGIVVRDHLGQGAIIVSVDPAGPGSHVFNIGNKQYESLQAEQVIVQANGNPVTNASDLFDIARASKPVLRLTTRDPSGTRSFLMKLKY